MINFYFITLFPEALKIFFSKGLILKAVNAGKISLNFLDLRLFSKDGFHIDDTPFGGNKGMLLKADILYDAVTSIDQFESFRLLCASPQGVSLNQNLIRSWSKETSKGYIFIIGYYEGIDERLFHLLPIEKVSLGDFILSSGELPSLVISDAIIRLIPDVVNNKECITDDSFEDFLLEYPQYTRPKEYKGLLVPDVLTSGHHQRIKEFRAYKKIEQTCFTRPDLFAKVTLNNNELNMFKTVIKEASCE